MIKRSKGFDFPFVGKIKPGAPKSGNAPGRNLPHFRLVSSIKDPAAQSEHQAEIEAVMGKEPKELRIYFKAPGELNEEQALEYVFDDAYEAYKANGLWCRGDGETALRAVKKGELEQVPCKCPEYGKTCKQWGTLKCIPAELPIKGLWTLRVSSWNSINQIHSVLRMFYNVLGKRFFATQCTLYKEEQMISTPQGMRKQFITKIRVAPEFAAHIPTGQEFSMSLGSDEDEFPVDEISSEPLDMGLGETPAQEPASHQPEKVADEPEQPTHFTSDGEDIAMSEPPAASPPEPAEQPAPAPAPTEPKPPSAPVVDEAPPAEPVAETPAVAMEPAQPVPTATEGPLTPNTAGKNPLWRAKAAKVASLVSEVAKLRNEKDHSALLKAYGLVSFSLEDYTEKDLTVAITNLNQGIKELKEGVSLLTESDIPF